METFARKLTDDQTDYPVFFGIIKAAAARLRQQSRASSADCAERSDNWVEDMHSLDFYQATLDSLQTTVAIIDGQGLILFVNRSWREFAANNGADPQFVSEGCNYFTVCETSAAQGCVEARSFIDLAIQVLHRELPEFVLEYPCHSPDLQRWFQVRVTLLQHDRNDRIVVAHEDITLTKRAILQQLSLERQLRQAQKLESLGTLAGGIAHDFNNILTAVLGFTELCLDRAINDPVMKEDLEEVYQASLRARELVHQILTFSRRAEQELKPLDIALIIKEAVKLLRSTLPSTIEIKSRIVRDVGMVLADPTRIHQILMNLCTNAAHAMRETGGVLSLSLSTHEAGEEDRISNQLVAGRTYVRLEVSDTGCGMDSELVPLIFDPYFTTKQQGEGTGLGLAVVHGIVRDYNGAIGVVSAPAQGSSIAVYLPKYLGEQEVSSTNDSRQSLQGRGQSLLIVDDELGITRLCRKILEGAGYRIYTENDSVQALAAIQAKRQPVDLLISDMTMPRLTGEKLVQEVRRINPDLPIILVSGNSPRLPESLADFKAIELLAKPIDRDRRQET
ncbi:MAG: response regulator, partial [Desulfofustis sp.]|nr:response regulator [Desulfofustis sp.]